MEWVASTLHTTSEHGVSSITNADTHTSAASSRLNWRPPADLNGLVLFARKTKSGFCTCAITFQTQSIHLFRDVTRDMCWRRLYREHAFVAAIALYLCEAHTSVLLKSEADRNARQCCQFSVAKKKSIFFWSEWKGGIRKCTKVPKLRNNWRRDVWSRNLRPLTYKSNKKRHFLLLFHQPRYSLGLVHCTSNLPAVVWPDVCVRHSPVPRTDKHWLLVTQAFLPSEHYQLHMKSSSSATHTTYIECFKITVPSLALNCAIPVVYI